MSDPAIDRLLEKANEWKSGPQRVRVLQEAVALADANDDVDAGFRTRLALLDAATFGGRNDLLIPTFAWCLDAFDRDPDRFDENDLLWKYKWVVGNSIEFPDVSRAQIEAMFADITRRFAEAGSTLHGMHSTRRDVYLEMGDRERASQAAAALAATQRDWLSDCRACVHDSAAGQFADDGQDEQALAEAEPVISGRFRCRHVPHRTYSRLLVPLLRLGRVDEALAHHKTGRRLIGSDSEHLLPASRHLEFLVLMGYRDEAIDLLLEHLPNAIDATSTLHRMHFYAAARMLFEQLRDSGDATVRLRLPPAFALHQASNTYATADLASWFNGQVVATAARFDARNGNDHYARWFAGRRELKSLAHSAAAAY